MFKTPIQLLNQVKSLPNHLIDDLDINKILSDIFEEESDSDVRKSWASLFTTDTRFLKDTQKMLRFEEFPTNRENPHIRKLLADIRSNPSFCEKYEYITIDYFKHLNTNEHILQLISVYSLTSPVLSLLAPLIMLLVPFFILRVSGKSITISSYFTQLKKVFSGMPIGKLLDINNVPLDQRGFILFSVILYFVQIYQNTITCYKFYRNSQQMIKDIHNIGYYSNITASSMEECQRYTKELLSYTRFNESLTPRIEKLRALGKKYIGLSTNVFREMGKRMKHYYDIYCDSELNELLDFTFSYHEYIKNITMLRQTNQLVPCKFSKTKESITNLYHPLLRYQEPVKNSVKVKNMILSGPNASGKTTMLKSTLINLVLSQQIGCGFYDKASVNPYHHFHCYINIPDTSDRDSLFQAEARRCKEILNTIENNPEERHFCLFDELFSGTNPYEAIACATAYLSYMNSINNTRYIMSTHYIQVCNQFKDVNYTFEEGYKLVKGITKIRGGIKVLQQLEFPEKILKDAKEMVSLN
jgi:hypothetical protein